MVWVGVSARGTTPLVFSERNLNTEGYTAMLSDHLMPLSENEYIEKNTDVQFMQNNASCHRENRTMDLSCLRM